MNILTQISRLKSVGLYLVCFTFFYLTIILQNANAAQTAVVIKSQAKIRVSPSNDAEVIEERSNGEKLRISSFQKNGWYKVKTRLGDYGWVWQADISPLGTEKKIPDLDFSTPQEDPSKKREARQYGHSYFIRVFGANQLLMSSDISTSLGRSYTHIYLTPTFFGDVAVSIQDGMRLVLRAGYYSASETLFYNNTNYEVSNSGTPLLLGLEVDVYEIHSFELSAAVYGGLSLNNNLFVKAVDFQEPNSFSANGTAIAFLINWSGRYSLSSSWSLIAETGFYFTQNGPQTIQANFNGSTPFLTPDGSLASPRIRHVSPYFGAGIQLSF